MYLLGDGIIVDISAPTSGMSFVDASGHGTQASYTYALTPTGHAFVTRARTAQELDEG